MVTRFDKFAMDYERMGDENPVRVHVERHTMLHVLGDVRDMEVLDLGCGEGQYTRLMRVAGAARVVGADVAEGMLEHARSREREERLGVRYLRRDIAHPPSAPDADLDGAFDVVLGVYVLPYAASEQELTGMCRTARRALPAAGGRFVTACLNPDVSMVPGWYDAYGFEVLSEPGVGDGPPFQLAIRVGEHVLTLDAYRWSVAAHERALRGAGFEKVTWIHPGVSDEGRRLFGDAFWRNYLEFPHTLILDCVAGPAAPIASAHGPG